MKRGMTEDVKHGWGRTDESYSGTDEQLLRHRRYMGGERGKGRRMAVVMPGVSTHSNFNIGPVIHKDTQRKYG